MDEFGSPISGGIKAVRRNISSSFLGAPQTLKPDTITTDLLQEQSLKLTSVSSQLSTISRQITSLDFNLKVVKENLVLNQQLERQREAAKQKRERILAEQGLREGKESALEGKIQSSLTQPLQRIGQKTQGILGGLTQFLMTLAGGWLTLTGIDLLQAMAEGNIDKINRLKVKFLGGLTILLGSLTAIQIGIKKTVGLIGIFAGNIARVAFGGLLKASLFGVRLLLAGLVKKASRIGGGFFTGATIGGIAEQVAGYLALGRIEKMIFGGAKGAAGASGATGSAGAQRTPFRTIKKKFSRFFNPVREQAQAQQQPQAQPTTKLGNDVGAKLRRSYPKGFNYKFNNPSILERARSGAVGLFNRGKNLVDDGVKAIGSSGIVTKAKNLTKGLPKVGVGKLLGKVLGPFITFFSELLSEDGGLMSALAATAGFMAGAKVGAIAGGAIGALFGGIGAGPGAFIGALIGGFAGESVMKNLSKKIMNALGMKDVKIFGNKDAKNEEVEGVSADSTNVEPVKNSNLDAANTISNFSEEKTEVIDLSQNNNSLGGFQEFGGGNVSDDPGNTVPDIEFDGNNVHATTTTALTGVGP